MKKNILITGGLGLLGKPLAKLSTNVTNLLKEEAALQRLLNATDDLATKKRTHSEVMLLI